MAPVSRVAPVSRATRYYNFCRNKKTQNNIVLFLFYGTLLFIFIGKRPSLLFIKYHNIVFSSVYVFCPPDNDFGQVFWRFSDNAKSMCFLSGAHTTSFGQFSDQ